MKTRVRSRVCACVTLLLLFVLHASFSHEDIKLFEDYETSEDLDVRVQVSGRAVVPGVRAQDWISSARVLLDGDKHVGFIRCVNDVKTNMNMPETRERARMTMHVICKYHDS